jgi:DNA-damage-inducible protein J
MMATLQIRIDDATKSAADALFDSLGLDTGAAVRIFIAAALEYDGLPFPVMHRRRRIPNAELREAMEDTEHNRNLYGPYKTVDDAMQALLED